MLKDKLMSIGLTPMQMLSLAFSLASLDYFNRTDFTTDTVVGEVFQGDISRAISILGHNARSSFQPGHPKHEELKNLVMNFGLTSVIIAILKMIVDAARGV